MEFTAQQIADFLQGTVEGDAEVKVSDVSKIEEGRPGTLSFLSNPKYTHYIYDTNASIVLVNNSFVAEHPVRATLIRVENAYDSLAKLLQLAESVKPKKQGVSPLAYVAESAKLGENVYVGPFACVGEQVVIGKNTQIYPHTFIDDNTRIGDDCLIKAGVKIGDRTVIGNRCILQHGVVLGSDGFGFAPQADGKYDKLPQVGNVVIEDDVEIQANTVVDRATMGSTVIRRGVKLDNLIQIAHNVEIGEDTVMASQSGVAGKLVFHDLSAAYKGRLAVHAVGVKTSVRATQTGHTDPVTPVIHIPQRVDRHQGPHFQVARTDRIAANARLHATGLAQSLAHRRADARPEVTVLVIS